ncbi:MAG: recombinase family protein [Flavobacteriaceae bacterium]
MCQGVFKRHYCYRDIGRAWARSFIHFTKPRTEFEEKGVKFKRITEPFIDTTEKSSHSELIINIFATLAQLERGILLKEL